MKKFILSAVLIVSSAFASANLISFDQDDITPFGGQAVFGDAILSNGGTQLEVVGNYWVDVLLINSEINSTSLLNFEFKTDSIGELHGIGFAFDDVGFGGLYLQFGGTQTFGNQDYFRNLSNGVWESFSIDLSNYDLTSFDRVVFFADTDASGTSTNSVFRNLNVSSVEVSTPALLSLILAGVMFIGIRRRVK